MVIIILFRFFMQEPWFRYGFYTLTSILGWKSINVLINVLLPLVIKRYYKKIKIIINQLKLKLNCKLILVFMNTKINNIYSYLCLDFFQST